MKEYLERQWHKILANRVSVQDFVFAKEVRLGTYSPKAAVVPPAAIVAAKAMATDPRAEPRFAERVPYVVVYGEPGTADPFGDGDLRPQLVICLSCFIVRQMLLEFTVRRRGRGPTVCDACVIDCWLCVC